MDTTRIAQNRPGDRNRGIGDEPVSATPSQLDRLEATRDLAREAETRVREIDPRWKPKPTLSDPIDIESRIARNEDLTRQANARFAEYLSQEKYPGLILPRDLQPGTLIGPRARILERDDAETRRGKAAENHTADILFLNGHTVRQLSQRTNSTGVKKPDLIVDKNVFDTFAPATSRARNMWAYALDKVRSGQAENVVLNLRDSPANVEEIIAQFHAYPIPGLSHFWIIERNGRVNYVSGGR